MILFSSLLLVFVKGIAKPGCAAPSPLPSQLLSPRSPLIGEYTRLFTLLCSFPWQIKSLLRVKFKGKINFPYDRSELLSSLPGYLEGKTGIFFVSFHSEAPLQLQRCSAGPGWDKRCSLNNRKKKKRMQGNRGIGGGKGLREVSLVSGCTKHSGGIIWGHFP